MEYFGQLPNKIIFRQIEELQGMSLSDYIDKRLFEWQLSPENKRIQQNTAENEKKKEERSPTEDQRESPKKEEKLEMKLITN